MDFSLTKEQRDIKRAAREFGTAGFFIGEPEIVVIFIGFVIAFFRWNFIEKTDCLHRLFVPQICVSEIHIRFRAFRRA